MPTAEAPCHSSTPCQHFTDPYRQGELKGGGAGMLAGGREKEEGGRGGGCSGMKASAMMLYRGKEDRYSRLDAHVFRLFYRLELDKQNKWMVIGLVNMF